MRDFIVTSLGASSAVGESGCKPTFETKEANVENITVLDVMNATSNDAVAKLVKIWENKNAQRALRGAGLSTMALSLAACGGSSTPAVEEPAPVEPEVTPVALELTTDNDILTAVDFTTAADTVSGTQTTYEGADVLVEGNAGDGDTLTVTATDDVSATPTVVGFENIVFNVEAFTTAAATGTVFDLDAAGIAGGEITVNVAQVGSAIVSSIVSNAGGVTVTAGTDIATLTVNMVADAATIVNSGAAANVVVDADAATAAELAAQTITVVAADDIDLTVTDANNIVISGTGDVTLNANSLDIAGDVATITGTAGQSLIVVDSTLVEGTTITGFDTVSVDTNANADVALDARGFSGVLSITATANVGDTFTIASGGTVSLDADVSAALDINDGAATDATDGVANVTLAEASAAGGSEIEIEATNDLIGTLNITAAANQTVGDLLVTASTDLAITLAGAGNVDFDSSGVAGETTLNASALAGNLVVAGTANLLTITGGAGEDNFTAVKGGEFVYDGGLGVDTLTVAAVVDAGADAAEDMTSGTFTGFELLDIADAVGANFTTAQLNGLEIIVTTGSLVVTDTIDSAVNDFSGIVIADGAAGAGVDMTGATIDAAALLAGQAISITGTGAIDILVGAAGGDTIVGGAGADEITGNTGADVLTGGAGADTFVFAAGDTGVLVGDTITDFTSGTDVLDFGATAFVIDAAAAAAVAGTASIAATGIATFAAADDTLAEKLAAIVDAITDAGATVAGEAAVFEHDGTTYLFASGDTDTTADADDLLIALTGVELDAGITIAAGNITEIA